MQLSDLGQELIDAEREGWEALASGHGGEHYRTHVAPTAVMAFSLRGDVEARAIDAMEAAPPWSSFDLVDPQVVELSADSGIVVYLVSAQRAGEEPYAAIVSSTFVCGDGRWLLAFHQQTPAQLQPQWCVMRMVALHASRSMPIGASPPCDGLITSIFCRSRSSCRCFRPG
jgi:hypothetical protein